MDLVQFKKHFEILKKKYKLPTFEQLNEDFEIDKFEKETDTLLRSIRKMMIDKIVNSIGFLDMLLNTQNAPRTYQAFIRSMTLQDREAIQKLYGALADLSIESISCEIEYNEKAEADLIKKIASTWSAIRPTFKTLVHRIRNPTAIPVTKKDKSYFG